MWQLKWQLEDLGFRHQEPEKYREIALLLDEKRTERLEYIENFLNILRTELKKYNIHFEVAGRPKHIYSIYKKMVKKKLTFDGLFDIRAVRILVDTIPECYTTLGIVHSLWQPIPGEFDDYIANPKGNGYKVCTPSSSAQKTKVWKSKSAPSICTNSTNSVLPPTGVIKKAAVVTLPTNKNRLAAPTLRLA